MKLIESILLFGSLALLIMFADQFVYKGVKFADSYFFLMFGLAGFLFYTYRRGLRIMKENEKSSDEKGVVGKKKRK